jgi:acetyl/propionyl-CoA carboxylase alpha subunit
VISVKAVKSIKNYSNFLKDKKGKSVAHYSKEAHPACAAGKEIKVEAMKMRQEIKSKTDDTVSDIKVTAGGTLQKDEV